MRNQDNLDVCIAVLNQLTKFLAQNNSSVTRVGLDGATVRAVVILLDLNVLAILGKGVVRDPVILGYVVA